jgi:DNA-directed RNA polymerase subunit M/transcription elongation factor TFIIS
MPNLNIDVWCAKCGDLLYDQTEVKDGAFHVSPCKRCMEEANNAGYDEGRTDGLDEAREEAEEADYAD